MNYHRIKNTSSRLYILLNGWATWIRTKEMPDSESGALPLGYSPIDINKLYTFFETCKDLILKN